MNAKSEKVDLHTVAKKITGCMFFLDLLGKKRRKIVIALIPLGPVSP